MAGDVEADLIVMGTHGLTGLRWLLMGSVAESVVAKAACPVLVVKSSQGATAFVSSQAATGAGAAC
jgi:nucleotide-binding universal stress UspA family protein